MYDVVIIGSGPAGLSASIYAKRAGLKAVTIEKSPMSGGQVVNTYEVDNYPGLPGINGFDMGMKFREHADKLGCEFVNATVRAIKPGFMVETDAGLFETKTVLAAMGATHAKLNIPGEEELAGMGVSYCATCDGAFFKGKTTAVIGGGDVAVEDAIFLARGCEKVYLIHRRDELRAAEILQQEVKSLPNVEIIWDSVALSIEGEDQVESLKLKNVKTGEESQLSVDGVFVAVGILPESELLSGVTELDEKGYVIAGEDGVCKTPGIFVAGDIRTKKLRQIITAAADGANAITSIQEYLVRNK
ncbi:MAG: FAD-dependent oxidoreductase [Lachnospiraceae bacterium]|nr:FAD-dependent oxidoreductase [Lachnospiraceae bacterium]